MKEVAEGYACEGSDEGLKLLLVDAICGVGFPSLLIAAECEKVGMATFTGHQWTEKWEWRRERIAACSVEQLQELYQGLCESREENNRPVQEFKEIITCH